MVVAMDAEMERDLIQERTLDSVARAADAELFQSGRADARWVAQKVEEIIARADYSGDVLDLPLGQLHAVDDAWEGGWGPPVEELKAMVRARCEEQLRATSF